MHFIQLWQLETLLLQRDTYMNYSRELSTASTVAWSQNVSPFRPKNVMRRVSFTVRCVLIENWQRTWIILLWVMAMGGLFAWKLNQYRNRAAFQVMGYCLAAAKGAAETLKLNMALILLPVCRNMLTWLRSTRARLFIPFDDNINFHKVKEILKRFWGKIPAFSDLVFFSFCSIYTDYCMCYSHWSPGTCGDPPGLWFSSSGELIPRKIWSYILWFQSQKAHLQRPFGGCGRSDGDFHGDFNGHLVHVSHTPLPEKCGEAVSTLQPTDWL